ncbi:inorganic phosphate transporter [bacterium]|nr:inorganic phosphate transporter [bacterium]
MITSLVFLSSGIFLGWSLGANHAGIFWGTAVGTKMVRFKTAALLCSIFVVLGAVIGGSGASGTLNKLGTIEHIAAAFTVALAAAATTYAMSRAGLPISTSQAIIGGIIGWNVYSHRLTDYIVLVKIALTWVISPILTGLITFLLFKIVQYFFNRTKMHMVQIDNLTRLGLIIVGIFGSYALGANNIGNVMGVFVSSNPFKTIHFMNIISLDPTKILFFVGGIAIAVGVSTYSKKVMSTIGNNLYRFSPITALIVVLSVSLTMFLFASSTIHHFLVSNGLPAFPLVPISASQAIIGAVIGLGIARKNVDVNFQQLRKIIVGWIVTPIFAFLISYISLYFIENVFLQVVN